MTSKLEKVSEVLDRTDWALLRDQKGALLDLLWSQRDELPEPKWTGLIDWLDELQDAAYDDGYPVVFMTEDDEEQNNQGKLFEVSE